MFKQLAVPRLVRGFVVTVILAASGLVAADAEAKTRTITGRVLYGALNDDLTETSDPHQFIGEGSPIPFVTVELDGFLTIEEGSDITDADGRFSIDVTGEPNLTLVTKALNDFVSVKQANLLPLPTDDAVSTRVDITVDWAACPNDGDTCDIGDVTATNDNTDTFQTGTIFAPKTNYVSRALYVASAAHSSVTHVEEIHGSPLTGDELGVRMGLGGLGGTAYYETLTNTINLNSDDAVTFWHEFGHFASDKIAGFGTLPSYGSHSRCVEITDSFDNDPNLCWAWHEGVAEWYAAINASDAHGSYANQQAAICRFGTDTDGDGTIDCNPEYETEAEVCTSAQLAAFTDARAVESRVWMVLWDLVDNVQDVSPSVFFDEIADLTEAEVLAVITSEMDLHSPCDGADQFTHPVGLDEFFDQYRTLKGFNNVVPELFAAYAQNGVAIGNAADIAPPDPATIENASHSILTWSNDKSIEFDVVRGADDVSGSYRYFISSDFSSTGVPNLALPEAFRSIAPSTRFTVTLPDGADQYIHADSFDMAGNAQTSVTHFGPLKIDTVPPVWIASFLPLDNSNFVLGYTAFFQWGAADLLSGISQVTVVFEPSLVPASFPVATGLPAVGNYTWYVDGVPAGPGNLVFRALDRAGNSIEKRIPIVIQTPFAGANASLDARDARLISADLDKSGTDERILALDKGFNAGEVQVLDALGTIRQTIAWNPADDLYSADWDRDGDLDVITVSSNAIGGAMRLEILNNDGTGRLANSGRWVGLGILNDKRVRVAPLFLNGEPTLVVFGLNMVPSVQAFRATGLAVVALPGLTPVNGDWECGDVEGDGDIDFVALGIDSAGVPGLFLYENSGNGAFVRRTLENYLGMQAPNVDLVDSNGDGLQDISVMLDQGLSRISRVLQRSGVNYVLLSEASVATQQVAQGDGYLVDLEADASSEALAMGSTETGVTGSWYLRNNSIVGVVSETAPATIVPLSTTDSTWGDHDGDGDLDLTFKGFAANGLNIGSYDNQIGDYFRTNTAPAAPTSLTSTYDAVRGGYVFTWTAPGVNSDQTPEVGFTYELRVGTTNGGAQILSWMHQAGPGLHGSGESRFVKLAKGKYFAQVRAVDSGWMRSLPSAVHQTKP